MSASIIPTKTSRWPIRIGMLLWLVLLLASGVVLWHYSTAPGASGAPVTQLPEPDANTTTGQRLVIFLHPHCSCSQATLRTLNHALQSVDTQLAVDAYFYTPDGSERHWHRTALWQQAEGVPGVRCHVDHEGVQAARYGVATSGHVLLFGPQGRRLFSGGITSGRGHEGANPGGNALVSLLLGHHVTTSTFPVYGCGILTTSSLATGTL